MNGKQAAVLLLTVVAASFFRLYQLDTIPPGLSADEATDGNDALTAWRTGNYRVFYPENNGREGLFINLQAVVLGVVAQSRPWALRLSSALLGTLTVVGMYLLAQQLGLSRTAWLAAWFMAVSFWCVSISRMGTRVAASPFFLVWSLWLWGKAAHESCRWWLWAGLGGFIYGLGFHTYTAYRVTPLLMLIAVRQYPRRVTAVAGMVAGVTVLPLVIYAARQPELFFHRLLVLPPLTLGALLSNTWKTVGMFNFAGDLNPRHNLPGRAMLWWPVGLLFATGVVVAWRRRRLLLWWLIIGLLPAIVANEVCRIRGVQCWRHLRVFLLAALGAEWLAERFRWRALAPVLGVAVAVESYRLYFVVWARDPRVAEWFDNSLMNVAARLDTLPRDLPKYVILDPDPVTVRGLPLAAQTIMFLTDTTTEERQGAKNVHYLWPDQTNQIALGYVYVYHIETTQP